MEWSDILKQKKILIKSFIVLFFAVTLISEIFLQNTYTISAANGDVIKVLNCSVTVNYNVKVIFNEYRQENDGTPTDDRCDNVKATKKDDTKIDGKVTTIRHADGTMDYLVTVSQKKDWVTKAWGTGKNYEYWQGSDIICSGYVSADNLTISGTFDSSKINSTGSVRIDITDSEIYNRFNFVMDNYYDTNTDWVIDYMDSTGTGITGISLEFAYPSYNIKYDSNGGMGSIPSFVVKYGDDFTLSNGSGFKKDKYLLDHWAVIRQSDNSVYCKDGTWHKFDGTDAYALDGNNCMPYQKNSSLLLNDAWINPGNDENDTFIFVAQWTGIPVVSNIVSYRVEHYLQNADGTYSLKEGTTGKGTVGSSVAGALKDYGSDSYVKPQAKSINLNKSESSNVIKYYYARTTYKINLAGDDGTDRTAHYSMTDNKSKTEYRWGETVVINAYAKDKYEFTK